MRKLLSIFLLLSSLVFSGCSDDLTDEYLSLIPGDWIASDKSSAWLTFHFELRFASDGTVQFLMQDEEATAYVNGTMEEEDYGFNEYGTYTIDDDEIFVKTENLWYSGQITKLNSTSLTVKRQDVYGDTVYDYFIKQ